ncbi:MAG: fibronectin type III domain-containing protein [Bacteroidales bacterium]|nr:fibronectin type III domain-containing protein [Bacteroidales bacterium]
MKKFAFILAFIVTLVFTSHGQVLTVGNGNATNEFFPLSYRMWLYPQRGQVLYPASMLTAMQGKYISGLSLYYHVDQCNGCTSTNYTHLDGTQTVRIGHTSASNLSGGFTSDILETVWEGTMENVTIGGLTTDGEVRILFDRAFLYQGGNLLIELQTYDDAQTNGWYFFFWYGQNTSVANSYHSGSYNSSQVYYESENFLPKTTFMYQDNACVAPSVFAHANQDPNSTTIHWDPVYYDGNAVADYEVAYRKAADSTFQAVAVTDTFYVLNNLESATDYVYKVRTYCGGSEYSFWSDEQAFRTDIAIGQFPYYCGFEDTQENNSWYRTTQNWLNNDYTWYIDTATSYDGDKAMYISKDHGATFSTITAYYDDGDVWAYRDIYFDTIYPAYNITFEHKGHHILYVYLGPPATPSGKGQPTGSVRLGSSYITRTDDWKTCDYIVDGTHTGLQRLYFLFYAGAPTNVGAAIDNVQISGIECIAPVNLAALPQDSSAVLTWHPMCATPPYGYVVAYKKNTDTAFTEINVTDTTVTLQNLLPFTDYTWKVSAKASDTVLYGWSATATFKTTVTPARSVPYFCDFEDAAENAGWKFVQYTGSNNRWNIGTSGKYTGSKGLHITSNTSNSYTYSSSSSAVWAYRDVMFDTVAKGTVVEFDYKVRGLAGHDFAKIFIGDTVQPSGFDIPTGLTDITGELTSTDYSPSWEHKTLYLSDSTFVGLKRIYLYWQNNYSSTRTPPIAIDNLFVYTTGCSSPSNLTATALDTTATLTWHPNVIGTAQSYTVAYKKSTDSIYTELSVTDTTAHLSNLEPYTLYDWKVKANCSNEESSLWQEGATFRTYRLFGHIPYACGFENPDENLNWGESSTSSEPNRWKIGTAAAHEGQYSVYISSDNGSTVSIDSSNYASYTFLYRDFVFSPEYPEHELTFDLKVTNANLPASLKIYASEATSPDFTWDYVQDDLLLYDLNPTLTVTQDTAWHTYSVKMDNTHSGIIRIVFEWEYQDSYNLGFVSPCVMDNVTIQRHEVGTPNHLTPTPQTDTSVVFSWKSGNNIPPISYTLSYRNIADSSFTEITIADTFFLLQPVTTPSSYIWQVRANGADTMYSDWSEAKTYVHTTVTLPMLCTFEDSTDNSLWNNSSYYGDYYPLPTPHEWYIGNAVSREGAQSMYVSSNNGTDNTVTCDYYWYLWTYRDVYFPTTDSYYYISLDYQGAIPVSIFIGNYEDNPNLTTSYDLDYTYSFNIPKSEIWNHYHKMLIPNDSSFFGVRRVYILWQCTNFATVTNAGAVDNFKIGVVECQELDSLAVEEVTHQSAKVSWKKFHANRDGINNCGDVQSYTVAYKPVDAQQYTEVNVSDTFCVLTGLQPDVIYQWKVRSNCGNSVVGEYSSESSFTTLAALPYFCDFEEAGENAKWHFANNSNTYWAIGEDGEVSGNNRLKVMSSLGTNSYNYYYGNNIWAYRDIYFNEGSSEYQISFDYRGMGQLGQDYMQLFIGPDTITVSGSTVPAELTQIGDNFCNIANYTHYSFTLDSTFAGTRRLFFYWRNNSDSKGTNPASSIDNIHIQATDCKLPLNPRVVAVQATSADLAWSSPDAMNQQFTVAYKSSMDTAFTEVSVNDTAIHLSGLLPNTSYYWYVRSDCAGSSHSLWSNSGTFSTTQLNIATLPYSCDFEQSAENSNWSISSSQNSNLWYIGNAVSHGGDNSLYVTADSGATNSYVNNIYSGIWAWRDIDFGSGYEEHIVSFDYKGKGREAHYARVFVGKPTMPNGPAVPDGLTQLGGALYNINDWTHYTFSLDSSYSGVMRLYIQWVQNTYTGYQPPAAFDNITIMATNCSAPLQLSSSLTADTVTLSWMTGMAGANSLFTVAYRKAFDSTFTEVNVQDTFLVLTGLPSNTDYIWKVRQNCGNTSDFIWSDMASFLTLPPYPYFCDFEDTIENSRWVLSNGSYPSKWYIGNNAESGLNHLLYISSDNGATNTYSNTSSYYTTNSVWAYRDIYINPAYDTTYISFDCRVNGDYYDNLKVFVANCVTPSGGSTPQNATVLINGLYGQSSWQHHVYAIPSSAGGLRRLFFLWSNDSYDIYNPPAAIDNIEIANKLYSLPQNLAATVIDTAAILSWQHSSGEAPSSYTVEYRDYPNGSFVSTTLTQENLPLGNLQPNTDYVWRVRANFSDGHQSFWVTSSFKTEENVARLPYYCDFEDTVENARWKFFLGNSTNKWVIDTAANHGGDKALYVTNNNGATNAYTVSSSSRVWACRDIYFDPQYSQFIISFDFKGLGENYGNHAYDFAKLFMGPAVTPSTNYSSSYVSPQGSTQIGTYLYLQNEWTTIQDTLIVISGTGMQRIYFLWENDGSYGDNPPAAIDNFSIVPFGCGKPINMVTSDLSANSATLSWDGTTSNFEVAYRLTSESNYTTVQTSDHSVTLGNLMSDSEYEWKVKTLCSDSSESEWSAPLIFSTYQNVAHLPYFCDFENSFESSNWSVVSGNENLWTVGGATSNGGVHSLYVTADSGTTNSYTNSTTYAIWTYRDIDFDEGYTEYELEFDYKGNGSNVHYCNVYLGSPVKPHPGYNAAPAGSSSVTQSIYNKPDWTHYSITLNSANSGVRRLYFQWIVSSVGSGLGNPPAAIDNMAVTPHHCVKPQNLQSSNVTDNTATLSWTHSDGASFVVAYRVEGSSNYTEVQAVGNPMVLDNLLSSTTYVWRVKAVCSSSEESAWSPEAAFTTNYFVAQLPYINGFEEDYENQQWRYFYQGSSPDHWAFGSAASNGGSNGCYISSDGGATNSYSGGYYNSWAWRDIYIDSATTQIQISFDYRGMGYASAYNSSEYGRLLFGIPTTPYYVNNDGITDLTGELKLIPDWTHYHYVVDVSNITGVRRIYLHWHSYASQGSNPPAAFDNLTIIGGDCGVPNNLTVDNVTQNSISFHFSRSSAEDVEWQVAIAPEGTEVTDNQIVNIYDTFYTFTGLDHTTLYRIYARNVCNEESFWNYISQYTECGPISELPFAENFNVNTTPENVNLEFPRCWTRSSNNVGIGLTFNTNSLEFGGAGLFAVLPEMDSSIAVSDLQISFTMEYFNNSPGSIVVGVMDDPNDITTFTPIDEVSSSPAQSWTYRHVPFNSYQGSGRYIALKSLNWTYVDNLVVDYISGCPFPTHVTASGVTNNSINLTWTPTGNESEWQVIAVEEGGDIASATPQTATTTNFTLSGLLPSTSYVAYVRAVCGDGGFSTWERSDPFTTVCDPISEFPIVENFDEYPVPTVYVFNLPRPECWSYPEFYGQNYPGVDFYESYSGTNSLKFIAGNNSSYSSYNNPIHATAVSPMLNADIHQLSVRFMLKSNWLYYPEGMEVGVMSDPYDMSTFESVELIVPPTSNEWYEFLVEFDSTELSGSGNFIAFRYTGTYNQRYNWIDDIVIDYSSHVVFPSAPTNLVATNVTSTTADLSWDQDSSQVSGWKVEYRKAEESEWISLFVDDMSCHLAGLEPDESYVARVAAHYEDLLSDYSNECTFVTEGVGISGYTLEDKVSVYPNPAHHYLVISSEEGVGIRSYTLYSTDGKRIRNVSVENLPVQVPVADLANGIYFLEIVCDEGVIAKKIVKK